MNAITFPAPTANWGAVQAVILRARAPKRQRFAGTRRLRTYVFAVPRPQATTEGAAP